MSQESSPTIQPELPEEPAQVADHGVTVITAKDAAKLLGVHHTTLYEAAKSGQVPCRRVGRRYVFVREVLVAWLSRPGASVE